jgi:hypothetical protein
VLGFAGCSRWKKLPGNGTCSGFGACAHVAAGRLVRVDVAVGQRDRARPRDQKAAALPEEWCSLSKGSRKALPSGRWKIVPSNGRCSGLVRVARRVRVDVAVGELHVIAVDVEAAALPEERRSLSEGSRKVLPSGRWEKVPGNGRCSGSVSARVLGCMRVLLSVGGWCRPAARRTPCHTQTREGVSSGGRWKKLPGNDRCSGYVGARVLGVCAVFGF